MGRANQGKSPRLHALITTVSPALITTVSPALIATVSPALITTVSPALITTVSPALITTVSRALITTVSPALWMHGFHDKPHSLGSGMMHARYWILHQTMACSIT